LRHRRSHGDEPSLRLRLATRPAPATAADVELVTPGILEAFGFERLDLDAELEDLEGRLASFRVRLAPAGTVAEEGSR
jgi:hypothetical protein